MTAPADVLAVLDTALETIGNSEHWWMDSPTRGGFDADAITEARAAVAELIAAAESAMGAIRAIAPAGVTYEPRDRLQAALARCGGAA